MKKWFLFIIVICISTYIAKGQLLDSISATLKEKPKFVFSFDARYAFLGSERVKISGLKPGIDFNNKIRFGIGIYFMTSPFFVDVVVNNDTIINDTLTTKLQFGYFSFYTEYILFHNRKWEFSVPLQFGLGSTGLEHTKADGKIKILDEQPVTLLELSLSGHYKFFSWLGIGAGVGYRKILSKNKQIRKTFDSPIYILKLKLFFEPIFGYIFPKKKKREK